MVVFWMFPLFFSLSYLREDLDRDSLSNSFCFSSSPPSLNLDKIRDRVWWNIHSFVYSPVLMTSPLGSWKNTCEFLTGSCGYGKLVFLVSVFTITWSFIILGSRFEEAKTNSTIRWLYNCMVLLTVSQKVFGILVSVPIHYQRLLGMEIF